MKNLSIIIPVHNEELNVKSLYDEIITILGPQVEIIFVDDGSTDQTLKVLKECSGVRTISLTRNFGQSAAIKAGIDASERKYIALMDGDGQNNPQDLPRMLDALISFDLDVICGWRANRKDSLMKKFVSKGAWRLRQILVKDNIHDSGCTLKVFKASSIKNIDIHGELHRFIPALMVLEGYKISEIVVSHRNRSFGKTKYNWRRIPKGFLDMLAIWFWSKYKVRPLHFFGSLGLFSIIMATLIICVGIFFYVTGIILFRNILPIISLVLVISGLNFIILGLLSDSVSRIYFEINKSTRYRIKSETN